MANDMDMLHDIRTLKRNKRTQQEGRDLDRVYFYKYVQPSPRRLTGAIAYYEGKYGSMGNYFN